jgi:hypothetical protein
MYYWEEFPSGVAILLALCNLPKAVRQLQRQHQSYIRQRDPSLSLGGLDPRLEVVLMLPL